MSGRTRAIGYIRVSTDKQAERGFGLPVQERAIRDWTKREGVRLVDVERDEGISGSNGLDSRLGLARALVRLRKGEAETLVVYRLDRLARDLVLQETTIQQLGKAGVRVVSVAEPAVDGDEPTRDFVRQVLGAMAQFERAKIRGRMQAGIAAKKAGGGYVGGRPGYGYSATGGKLEPVKSEQDAIALARRLRKRGASLRAIARELDAKGFRTKAGRQWAATQVARALEPATRRQERAALARRRRAAEAARRATAGV